MITIDPGHGGPNDVGAAAPGIREKDVNLKIALTLREILEKDGYKVVLTRDGDRIADWAWTDAPPRNISTSRLDLQARIDIANRAQSDLFICIHNNGSTNPAITGTEVWYDGRRSFAAYNLALAQTMLETLVEAISATGYPDVNRGLKEDTSFRVFRNAAYPIFVLGPPRTGAIDTRATQMPAILGETLFLSNPVEAELLKRDDIVAAIAQGYREGVRRYFQMIDQGKLTIPEGGLAPEMPNNFSVGAPPPSNP